MTNLDNVYFNIEEKLENNKNFEKMKIFEHRDEQIVIEFIAYKYFKAGIEYDYGLLKAYKIENNEKIDYLLNDKGFKYTELDKFFEEFIRETELRIPDKYLREANK